MTNFPGFIGPAYESGAWKASFQRCVNWYPEENPEKGWILRATPGTTLLGGLSADTPVLAMLETPTLLVAVGTNQVDTFTEVSVGVLHPGTISGPISSGQFACIAQAGTEVLITNGQAGYWFDRTASGSSPTLITSPGFPAKPQYCTAIAGRFVVNTANSGVVFWSDQFDASSWDPLEFAEAEMLNDNVVRPITLERDLYIIGSSSTEIWAPTETTDVFAPITGTFIPYGTIAPETVATIGRSLCWLSRDQNGEGIIIRASGLQAQRISTHAMEEEIRSYSHIADAYAWVYQQLGHEFYVISFPTAQKTWVLDLTTGKWHERTTVMPIPGPQEELPADVEEQHHVGRCHAYFRGYNVIGSRTSDGNLYSLDPNIYHDETNGFSDPMHITRVRTSPHIFANGEYNTVHRVEFWLLPGAGLKPGAGVGPEEVEPLAGLRISKDGGKTWGEQRFTSTGKQGEYKTRIGFNRCGRARDIIVELTVTARVPVALTSAQFDAGP